MVELEGGEPFPLDLLLVHEGLREGSGPVDRDMSPEAVARRLEELRALCELGDALSR